MDDPHRLPVRVARGMGALEPAQELARHVDRQAGFGRTAVARGSSQEAEEVAAVDELHREPWLSAREARRVDLHDVIVADGGVQRGLAFEHRASVGVGREGGEQRLDAELGGHRVGVDGACHVDLRRPAYGEPRLEPIRAKFDRPARQSSRHALSPGVFARRHLGSECIYAGRRDRKMTARVLIGQLAFAVPVLAMGLAACQGCRSSAPPLATAPSAGADAPAPTARLYFVTDLAGALEPCGCTKDQLGGLDHFGAWVRQGRTGARAALVASAGPLFFMDAKLQPERAEQDRIKAKTIARVLRGLDFAAFAPGTNDWAEGGDGLAMLANEAGAA